MKYNLVRIQGKLDKYGDLREPVDLPKGAIILSSHKNAVSTLLILACLVPVKEAKK